MRESKRDLFLVLVAVCCLPCITFAGTITVPLTYLGTNTGWEVSFDDSLRYNIGVHVLGLRPGEQGAVIVELDKWFDKFKDPIAGFDPYAIRFTKINLDTTFTKIIIPDEFIVNGTDHKWYDFHFALGEGPVAGFDSSVVPDGGQLPNVSYSDPNGYLNLPTQLNFVGDDTHFVSNTYPDNVFQPGYASGYISIITSPLMGKLDQGQPVPDHFILKEWPTPEPGTCMLLLGGLAGLRWMRRR